MPKKRIYLSSPTMYGEELQFIHEAFDTNWVAPLGPNVNMFEKEMAEYTGCGHAAALSAGTAAIHLALKLADVKEGDMIIAVNGKDLDTYEVLLEVIENGKVGDALTLKICRVDANYNISTFDVTVKLVEDSMTSVQEEEPTDNGFYFPFGN